ncbi:hypothetical protein HOD20_03300 [archaeon]|jgi:hypothetical protein|nr:hypothetical protein [archaeon]MBT4351529.1 hypothetical protein [archaeon]MBT4646643.1 hypothetical protein [archaeon]MBT6821908.1 hypothetical protein [archaeon]
METKQIEKINKLKSILVGDNHKQIKDVIKKDILSNLINNDQQNNNLIWIHRYKTSSQIKDFLINQYSEVKNAKHPRKIFTPGIFVGLQGKMNCAILTKYVIENILNWDFGTAVHKSSYKIFYENHLRCVEQCFGNLYELLIECYPERNLKPYYFKNYKNIWKDEKGIMKEELVRGAIREFVSILTEKRGKYRYKLKTIPKWMNYKLFQKSILPYGSNLSYMLSSCFGNSPIKAIIFAYPEMDLKPYYFSHVPKFYWSGEKGMKNAEIVMKEFIDTLINPNGKYQFTKQEVMEILKYKTYHKKILPYGKKLGGMLQVLFHNSPTLPLKLLEEEKKEDLCPMCKTVGLPQGSQCEKYLYCRFPRKINSKEE